MKKIFGNTPKTGMDVATDAKPPGSATAAVDIQAAPIEATLADGGTARLKIDVAAKLGTTVFLAGWRVGDLPLALRADGVQIAGSIQEADRPDVNENLGIASTKRLGFVFSAMVSADASVLQLEWSDASGTPMGCSSPLVLASIDDLQKEDAALGAARGLIARHLAPFSPEWNRAVSVSTQAADSSAKGFLEAAAMVQGTAHLVVCGWVATEQDGLVWLEDDEGNTYPLDGACWRSRHDVYAAVGPELGSGALNSGFVAYVQAKAPTKRIRLKALTGKGVHLLGETACAPIAPDPLAASRWLFGIQVQEGKFWQRFERVSRPILESLIERSRKTWSELPVVSRMVGPRHASPKVSIVVPLYGRFDFVESQMVEWARDPWIREHCELIYVVDDPDIAEPFRVHAEELHKLYGIPLQWVWGGVNRGFSGANNLGAAHANGEYLLFLNSDVFPQKPGWLQQLVAVLASRADIGVVGPRLTFVEGGIQHAGMQFERMEEFGVWINRHPYLGLDPALDPHKALTIVPAVTGACMLLRRSDFDAVGGWDTGYLIGDFEDSDLCLKLRGAGLHSAYLPLVQLTHLERQSFVALGSFDYRQRVTLWNALRHQGRWAALIEAPLEATR